MLPILPFFPTVLREIAKTGSRLRKIKTPPFYTFLRWAEGSPKKICGVPGPKPAEGGTLFFRIFGVFPGFSRISRNFPIFPDFSRNPGNLSFSGPSPDQLSTRAFFPAFSYRFSNIDKNGIRVTWLLFLPNIHLKNIPGRLPLLLSNFHHPRLLRSRKGLNHGS